MLVDRKKFLKILTTMRQVNEGLNKKLNDKDVEISQLKTAINQQKRQLENWLSGIIEMARNIHKEWISDTDRHLIDIGSPDRKGEISSESPQRRSKSKSKSPERSGANINLMMQIQIIQRSYINEEQNLQNSMKQI